MRNRRNRLWAAVAIVVIAGGILAAIMLRRRAAPDAVRLLPDSDAVLYVNLEPVRLLTDLGKKPPKERDPQYEDFVRQTGFEFERDLDKAAFAVHYAAPGKDRPAETRYSEIFQGHFDSGRVSRYLRSLASKVESYHEFDIYVIPLEGRTVRVTLLAVDIAAASNTDDPAVIQGIIDRYKQAALPFAGPPLVSEYYRRVPLGSLVWTIARPPASRPRQEHGEFLLPGAWSGLLPEDSIVIASARPLNDIHLKAEVITPNEEKARSFTEQVGTYITLVKALDVSMDSGGPDLDVKAAFDSLAVRQDKNEAILTAKVPYAFFKKLMSEPPVEIGPETEKPPEQNAPPAKTKPTK